MAVYLLHFDNPNGSALHYVGWTRGKVADRVKAHRAGTTKTTKAYKKRTGNFPRVAHVWLEGDAAFEKQVKSWRRNKTLCPICCGGSDWQEEN